jgi:hypothetical protein
MATDAEWEFGWYLRCNLNGTEVPRERVCQPENGFPSGFCVK